MKKQQIKYIKELANRLPVVYQQSVSGFYEDTEEDGTVTLKPNVFNGEVNHVRRMKKAYENLGMEGIKSYLEMIHKLQIKRNGNVQKLLDDKRQELQVDDNAPEGVDRSLPDRASNQHTPEDNQGVLGGDKKKRRKTTEGLQKKNKGSRTKKEI
jgi:hypothetical protein